MKYENKIEEQLVSGETIFWEQPGNEVRKVIKAFLRNGKLLKYGYKFVIWAYKSTKGSGRKMPYALAICRNEKAIASILIVFSEDGLLCQIERLHTAHTHKNGIK